MGRGGLRAGGRGCAGATTPSKELAAVWQSVLGDVPDGVFGRQGIRTPLLLGGFGTDDNGYDPVQAVVEHVAEQTGAEDELGDWVLLAEFHGGRQGGSAFFWMIRRDDLAARRFQHARVLVDWNP